MQAFFSSRDMPTFGGPRPFFFFRFFLKRSRTDIAMPAAALAFAASSSSKSSRQASSATIDASRASRTASSLLTWTNLDDAEALPYLSTACFRSGNVLLGDVEEEFKFVVLGQRPQALEAAPSPFDN